ncbi:MAG: HAD domain-containing protein [Gammaproteobacteria bacterium]|nr:HAD domain-containing protein [Gammaproteobacteria bacterium]
MQTAYNARKKIDPKYPVIFLDIDGVLQPPMDQERFDHDLGALQVELAEKFNNDVYLDYDEYDLGAIYYDWDLGAVERLRKLCDDLHAQIVVSSDWRLWKTMGMLRDYFHLHGLDCYIYDKTTTVEKLRFKRADAIREYLDRHPDINRFIIIDDGYSYELKKMFPDNFVHTASHFQEEDDIKARKILSEGS